MSDNAVPEVFNNEMKAYVTKHWRFYIKKYWRRPIKEYIGTHICYIVPILKFMVHKTNSLYNFNIPLYIEIEIGWFSWSICISRHSEVHWEE